MQRPPVVRVRKNGSNSKVVTIPTKCNIEIGDYVVILPDGEYNDLLKRSKS